MKTILSKANFPEQELYLHKKNKVYSSEWP